MSQPIPKFSTTLNGYPVFIPAMVWHLPETALPEVVEILGTLDEHAFDSFGVCRAVSMALEPCIKFVFDDVYSWVGPAVCYIDHAKRLVVETWLEQYFQHRFGLCGGYQNTSVVHYSHEQISALRLTWLRHIINHLEEVVVK